MMYVGADSFMKNRGKYWKSNMFFFHFSSSHVSYIFIFCHLREIDIFLSFIYLLFLLNLRFLFFLFSLLFVDFGFPSKLIPFYLIWFIPFSIYFLLENSNKEKEKGEKKKEETLRMELQGISLKSLRTK